MTKTVAAAIAAGVLLCGASLAHADDVKGGFCQVMEARVSNPHGGLIQKKLWDYSAPTLGDAPVMGWVDVACADRGAPRADLQDFGKRIWFNLSGPDGAPAEQGRITVNTARVSGENGNVGLAIKGQTIYGMVMPRHDCVFVVSVWADKCPSP